ncbi:MAG: 30S ribosomal protein S18 [Candidatus Lambdaproteobacteria bacterium]|nr:30S ribosomal protein S18 [Candidatus Lambdaproteobacteria bacterium]
MAKARSATRRRGIGNRIIFPRRKTSELNALPEVPFKDVELLKQYITERGRIVPRRISGNTAQTQRALTLAIKRARGIALLSFSEGYVPQD